LTVDDRREAAAPAVSATHHGSAAQVAGPSGEIKHIAELDGIRGLAIGLVLIYHFVSASLGPLRRVAESGWVGVDLFFVLSGFLITRILLSSRGAPHYFRNFYARRALRVWPLYYVILAFAFVGTRALPVRMHVGASLLPFYLTFTQNIVGTVGFGPWAVAHTWSLAIEEQFYLVWPWVVFLLPRRSFLFVSGSCWVLTLAVKALLIRLGVPAMKADYFTFVRMDGLCAGALLASMVRRFPASDVLRVAKPLTGWTLALCVACFALKQRAPALVILTNHFQLSLAFAGFVAISFTGAGGAGPVRLLRSTPLVWLGQRSYGLYVWHFLVQRQMVRLLDHVPGLWRGGTWDLIRVGALVALSCGAASLSWVVVERPFLRLKDRLDHVGGGVKLSARA